MPGTTPIYGFPYPEPSDLVANYPALGQELAEDIEAVLPTLGGLTLIDDESFSAVASISLNNVFSATYQNYFITMTGTASANTDLVCRMRASGSDQSGSVYDRGTFACSTTTLAFYSGASSSTVGIQSAIYSANRINAVINVFDPFTASTQTNLLFTMNSQSYFTGFGRCTSTTQFDGITFFPNTGTITGRLRVYGLKGV